MYDVIIIGGGAAGVQCALYTARANLKTLIITREESPIFGHVIQNYYGLDRPTDGRELFYRGLEEAKSVGAEVTFEEVVHIDLNDGFTVRADKEYSSRAIVLAIGAKRYAPNVKNLKEFEGRGVSYCATCDAFFYRKKTVAVLGGGKYAASEAAALTPMCGKVYVVSDDITAKMPSDAQVIPEKAIAVNGGERVTELVTEKQTISVDGVFVAEGVMNTTSVAASVGVLTDGNYIKTDENLSTNIPGIFAAGDCVKGEKQIAKAVCDGMKAGFSVINYLRGKSE